jgi:RHS repeat-associated protein
VLTDTNTTPTILKRQAWAYDVAGNRTVDQTDDAVFATTHDEKNRLQSRAPGGPIVFSGSLNEEGTVTIDGQPAAVDAANNFRGTAQVASGTTTVTLKAKDASGNETTQQYEVDASGSTTSYTYDANGNLTSDGTKSYFWNALNQLVEVKEGSTTIATFEYDGVGRRTEKLAAGLTRTYIYDVEDIVEERISGSSSDTICYYHGAGVDEPLARKNSSDVVTYYLADHLGSVVQETNASGTVAIEREYDPWGVLTQGASTVGYAFTGREWDAEIGLYYYRARYYAAFSGTFIADDPKGLSAGFNLTSYVDSSPLIRIDPTGLEWVYEQSTGRMWHVNDTTGVIREATPPNKPGYSGHGEGVNHPGYEFVKDVPGEHSPGPIPRGTYRIERQQNNVTGSGTRLPGSMRLTPDPKNTMYGRDGFLIHGDNPRGNQTASTGCIILPPSIRRVIGNSGDNRLRVVR